jgi:hypothetical protein
MQTFHHLNIKKFIFYTREGMVPWISHIFWGLHPQATTLKAYDLQIKGDLGEQAFSYALLKFISH